MNWKYLLVIIVVIISIGAYLFYDQDVPSVKSEREQSSIVAAEIGTFANLLALRPKTAVDLSKVSGQYCFHVNLEQNGKMTHYAIDPSVNEEDVIDFINATPFISAGLKVDGLPKFPGKPGSMKPNQWYYLPSGEYEPHHGIKFSFPILMRAVNMD